MVGAAKPDFEEIIERAHHLREKTGSQERFLQYLRNQGLVVANRRTHYKVPAQGTDGFTTQQLDENDLTTDITLVYQYFQCSLEDIYTEYHWTWDLDSGFGELPNDHVSMGWPLDHYNYESEYHGERVSHVDAHADGGGSAWSYDDTPSGGFSKGDSHSSYAGCYLTEESTNEDRHIGAKYRHTYQEGDLEDWTWAVDSSTEDVHWVPTYSEETTIWNGGFESIYKSEAEHDTTNC